MTELFFFLLLQNTNFKLKETQIYTAMCRGTCECYLFTAIRQYLCCLSGADSREKRMKR